MGKYVKTFNFIHDKKVKDYIQKIDHIFKVNLL